MVCAFLIGCSAAATSPAMVPTERDHALCAEMCEKQKRCLGVPVEEAAIANCANGCYRNLEAHPDVLPKLRAAAACVPLECGAETDACKRSVQEAAEPAPVVAGRAATSLDEGQCRAVCQKIMECLGGAPSAEGQSIEGCSLGCVHGSRSSAAEDGRYRRVLGCAKTPCGPAYIACLSGE